MNRLLLPSILVPAMMLFATGGPACAETSAQDRADQEAASRALARGEILPITKILSIATRKVPGDVLKVKLERKTFGFQYEVKVLAKNGRVREVELDAKTGAIRSVEDE